MNQHCLSVQTFDALRDLQHFLHEPDSPSKAKAKQKLMRNLKVLLCNFLDLEIQLQPLNVIFVLVERLSSLLLTLRTSNIGLSEKRIY